MTDNARWLMGELEVLPLTPERLDDLRTLLSTHQPAKTCSCMWWRSSANDEANEDTPATPGLLAYLDGRTIGWCSLGPREQFQRLRYTSSPHQWTAQPVWSIVCFFVAGQFVESGVAEALLAAAVVHARAQGARTLECLPAERGPHTDDRRFAGPDSIYLRAAGFHEMARQFPTARPAPGPATRHRGVWQGEQASERPVLIAQLDPSTPGLELAQN